MRSKFKTFTIARPQLSSFTRKRNFNLQNYHIILRTANKRPYFHELLTFFMHQKCRLSINTFKKQQNTSTLTATVLKKITETPLPSFIGFLSEKSWQYPLRVLPAFIYFNKRNHRFIFHQAADNQAHQECSYKLDE